MKKILALLLSIIMVFALAACGENNTGTNTGNNTDTNQTQSDENSNASSATDKIVNDDGEEFTVDVSATGDVKDGAESLSGTNFELAGTTYSFPIKMSELFDNGWALSKGYEYQTEFDANTRTNLVSYYLVHESGIKIHLDQMTNDSAEKKDIKECTLTGFSILTYDLQSPSDFVVPGGIMPTSKASNVLSIYGDPNKTNEFTGYSYNLDDSLTYSKHKTSKISYAFSFNDDGTLYGVHIDYEV